MADSLFNLKLSETTRRCFSTRKAAPFFDEVEAVRIIHAVTNGAGLPDAGMKLILLASKRADAVCIREKNLTLPALQKKINRLLDCGLPPEKLILHSAPELAQLFPVRGVHFSESDSRLPAFKQAYPDKLAGRSVHSAEAARQAAQDGADYLYFGHVFKTNSKPGLPPRGLAALQETAAAVSIPVLAIGGINEANMASVRQSGAAGAAMISTFFPGKA